MTSPVRSSLLVQTTTQVRAMTDLSERIGRAERAATTGIAVSRPSDAPGVWTHAHNLSDSVRDQQLYTTNANRADGYVGAAEFALGEATNLMTSAIETAIQYSTEIYTDEDRLIAAEQVDALRVQMLDRANTEMGGHSVFAGMHTDGPAFDEAGVYQGDARTPSTRVGADVWAPTGYDGEAIFTESLQALDDLAESLRSGTPDDVADQLGALHDAQDGLILERASVGIDQQNLEDSLFVAESLELMMQVQLDEALAADPFEAYAELAALQTAYESAVQVAASSGTMGLFHFLR